ncbi:MAG: dTDP-4-dehydrorhamnose reductase [Thermoflexales bacterium]|nr:dTDP-4-dehydrorhamnose reductase [Thermoflexales bacterium]
MKILITGARGMLGTDLSATLSRRHTVTSTDIDDLDVRDVQSVFRAVEERQPECVIHLAALTDVDYCEKCPDEAFHTNALGTQHVALACQRIDAVMLYVSTISVFDGTKGTSYVEFDTPNPHSFYSHAKYQGERFVESLLSRYYIVRAGWMFGGGQEDKKFVAKIIELASTRDELKVVDDKFGSPTYTRDISAGIDKLVETGLFGTYHMVNTGAPCSRFEVAEKILEFAAIKTCRLTPVSSAHFPLPAPRPRMEAARNYQLELRGMNWMRPWPAALREYIQVDLAGRG